MKPSRRAWLAGSALWGAAVSAQSVVYPPSPVTAPPINAPGQGQTSARLPTTSASPVIVAAPPSNDPADRLAANLVILSQRPRDVNALIGAGVSAIAVGDGIAALGFLARAEELAPEDGRIKAALGSALLLVERPDEALRLFADASARGIPDAMIARDRGLAYDLRGDTRLAQRDYALAMRTSEDDELRRRYALSMGISGDRNQALALLDPLIAKGDKAAWRARAFVLAMNGNMNEAEAIANSTMPGGGQAQMASFLRRLAGLNAAERALAVNYGTLVNEGSQLASVQIGDPYRTGAVTSAGGASAGLIPSTEKLGQVPAAATTTTTTTASAPREPRRRPGGRARPSTSLAQTGERPLDPAPSPSAMAQRAEAIASETRDARLGGRIGQRLAPVDQQALPPEARGGAGLASARGARATPSQPSVALTGLATLPPPAAPRAADTSAPVATDSAAVAPVFEIPAAAALPPPKRDVPPAVLTAAVETPKTLSLPGPSLAAPPATAPQAITAGVSMSPAAGPAAAASSAAGASAASAPALAAASPASASVTPPASPGFSTIFVPPSAIIPGSVAADASPKAVTALPPSVDPASSPAVGTGTAIAAAATSERSAQVIAATPPASVAEAAPGVGMSEPTASPGIAAIIAAIEPEPESAAAPLPSEAELRRLRLAAQRKAAAAALAAKEVEATERAEKERKEAERAEAAKNPARLWVQVAGGANKSGLPGTWRKLQSQNPALFKGLAAWVTPLNRTNRLLVGPFKASGDARELVNKMTKAGLSGFVFTSAKGQDIERLAAK